jgi:hypothetical protein
MPVINNIASAFAAYSKVSMNDRVCDAFMQRQFDGVGNFLPKIQTLLQGRGTDCGNWQPKGGISSHTHGQSTRLHKWHATVFDKYTGWGA